MTLSPGNVEQPYHVLCWTKRCFYSRLLFVIDKTPTWGLYPVQTCQIDILCCLPVLIKGILYRVCLFVGCLTSQQQASVSQGQIYTDNFTWCHTEIEVADPTFYLTQSQYTDTRPTSPSADPITPGAWQGSHWSANF